MKWEFIESELMTASINAAFQRADVYADPKATTDHRRPVLREQLASSLRNLARQYSTAVSSKQHKLNIAAIADDLTRAFNGSGLLRADRFRIGIAQKALNLYLKYLWCLDKIMTPPHCPFDDGIIDELPLSEQQKKDLKWTALDSLDGYQTLVDAGLEKIKGTKHASLSDWELETWN
ncbi:MAG: hypothetical protein ABSD89_09735 [Halobacteriota archaeon]